LFGNDDNGGFILVEEARVEDEEGAEVVVEAPLRGD